MKWNTHSRKGMSRLFTVAVWLSALMVSGTGLAAGAGTEHFRGVVTYHLIPAKVMRVNRIVEDPRPGTSYIGEESLLFALERNPEVTANLAVVEVEYHRLPEPKVIRYQLFGEPHEVTVELQAVEVRVEGDISDYIPASH